MPKRLLDVGNCGPDHTALVRLVQQHSDAEISQAHGLPDALQALQSASYDLVTINRLMDLDGSCGLEIVKAIKNNQRFANTPVMLISNYPEYQDRAVEAGAVRGFGKNDLDCTATVVLLTAYLG